MFSNYIYVEIKQILRTRFALLLLLSLVFFTGFAIWNGVQSLAQKKTSIKNITAKHQEKLQTMKMAADSIIRNSIVVERWWIDPSNPLVIGEFGKGGMPIMIEPSAVSAIATGVSDLQKDVQLTYMTYTKNFSTVNDFENPINLTFGSFDLTFVLVFLLPLFVIALNYDLISSEREQGTLALLLSQPLNSKRIFLFKTLSKFFIIALIISALLFPLLLFIGIKSNTIFPYAIVFATLVYTLFWFVLSFLINLFNQSSAFNALACIGLWLLLVVIVPTQLSMVSELAYPIPSRAALMNEIRQFDVAFEANKEAILIDYFQKNSQYTRKPIAEQDAFDEWIESSAIVEPYNNGLQKITDNFEQKAQKQASFVENMMFFSPSITFQHYLTTLAGTGRNANIQYKEAMKAAQQKWSSFLQNKFLAKEKMTTSNYDVLTKMPTVLDINDLKISKIGLILLYFQCVSIFLGVYFIGKNKILTIN